MAFFLHKGKGLVTFDKDFGCFSVTLEEGVAIVFMGRTRGREINCQLMAPHIYTNIFDVDKRVLNQYTELDLGYYWAIFPDGKYRQRLEI